MNEANERFPSDPLFGEAKALLEDGVNDQVSDLPSWPDRTHWLDRISCLWSASRQGAGLRRVGQLWDDHLEHICVWAANIHGRRSTIESQVNGPSTPQ